MVNFSGISQHPNLDSTSFQASIPVPLKPSLLKRPRCRRVSFGIGILNSLQCEIGTLHHMISCLQRECIAIIVICS